MSDVVRYGLVCFIVLVATYQQGITGFGCTVLSLPIVTLLLGIHTAVPILMTQALLLAILIVLESKQHIVWREFNHIAILAGLGLPFGIWLRLSRPPEQLKWILAGFMLVIGTQGLIHQLIGKEHTKMSARKRLLMSVFVPLGGLFQGAFGAGGPLVVIYASRAIADKTLFRVTICMLWVVLNAIVVGQHIVTGTLRGHTLRVALCCLPFTVLGWFFGNKAHYSINDGAFRKVVYSVLIASGVFLVCDLVGLI